MNNYTNPSAALVLRSLNGGPLGMTETVKQQRYRAEKEPTTQGYSWRITDGQTESRVATCHADWNAELIVEALNCHDELRARATAAAGGAPTPATLGDSSE